MPNKREALIAIINNEQDFKLAHDRHWYRIPVASANKWLLKRWPPTWIAFYHTKALAPLAYGIYHHARVLDIRRMYRWQLFPNEPRNNKSGRLYHQILFEPLQAFPKPILSRRWRRIVFIQTTMEKLFSAVEINDLYDDSPLEDRLWAELKRRRIAAERQEFVKVKSQDYALDFAVYCREGQLDLETDGDTYHTQRKHVASDNVRDNSLGTAGWLVLRFSTTQIRERMADYCVPAILDNINRLGGLDDARHVPRRFDLNTLDDMAQLSLFDDLDKD